MIHLEILIILILSSININGASSGDTLPADDQKDIIGTSVSDTIKIVSDNSVPDKTVSVNIESDKTTMLKEIVVTARESHGITSSSRINRSAMEHLQPTSFSDLLELLPGSISQNPDMGKANTIILRETGAVSATGAKTDMSDDYAITSLGASFIIDGVPVSNDAAMQNNSLSGISSNEKRRSITNRGVDMRTISTDNIESVEIIRGIPSAEYGNLTSGLINIHRVKRATPFTARFKADEYSRLFSFGKGVSLKRHLMNADCSYLDSKSDPRNPRENYKRITASLRSHLFFRNSSGVLNTDWLIAADYTGSFDDVDQDPDLNFNKLDEYKSKYRRFSFTSDLSFKLKSKWVKLIKLNTAISYQTDIVNIRKQVAPQRASVAPSGFEEGISEGHYLLEEYIADFLNDSRQLSIFSKISVSGNQRLYKSNNVWKGGVVFSSNRNIGRGQIYDLSRPLSASWTSRPRSYRDVPALNQLSLFIEDNIIIPIKESKLELQAGLRGEMLVGLDSRYYLSNHLYLDPRLNCVWHSPVYDLAERNFNFLLAAGYGLTTRMPTSDLLFPQLHYNDMIQLNYYDSVDPVNNSLISLRTYIENPLNYELRGARNRKLEFRAAADWGQNRISVTLFNEKLTSGFRYSTIYNSYNLRVYDASAILPGESGGKPDISNLPFEDTQILNGYRKPTNGTRIDKQGIEFQFNSARFEPIGTALIINGAWFHTRYSNSNQLFIPVNEVINSTPVSNKYVGLYSTDEGRINDQLNTNFMFDTQISRWGLVFTTSIQCMWFVKSRRLRENPIPEIYLSADDQTLHPYTFADQNDILLQYLIRNINEAVYVPQTVPPAIYLNLKATKQIGTHLKISAFANRIIDYLPDYTSNGLTIRRTSGIYFGMEANLTF